MEKTPRQPVTAVIKGSGFSSNGGGFAVIHIDGAAYHPNDVAKAVRLRDEMLKALRSTRSTFNVEYGPGKKIVAVGYSGEGLRPLIQMLDDIITKAESN